MPLPRGRGPLVPRQSLPGWPAKESPRKASSGSSSRRRRWRQGAGATAATLILQRLHPRSIAAAAAAAPKPARPACPQLRLLRSQTMNRSCDRGWGWQRQARRWANGGPPPPKAPPCAAHLAARRCAPKRTVRAPARGPLLRPDPLGASLTQRWCSLALACFLLIWVGNVISLAKPICLSLSINYLVH